MYGVHFSRDARTAFRGLPLPRSDLRRTVPREGAAGPFRLDGKE